MSKSKYNPQIHNRRSIRLKGFDYSQSGMYFVTVCSYERKELFGNIHDDEILLNEPGIIVRDCWIQLPKHYPNIRLKVWQRNYYERIIRNENELNEIRKYIKDNPLKWSVDQENMTAGRITL